MEQVWVFVITIGVALLGLFSFTAYFSHVSKKPEIASPTPKRVVCLQHYKELEIQLKISEFLRQFDYDTEEFENRQNFEKWLWEGVYATITYNIASENCTIESLNRNLRNFVQEVSDGIDSRVSRKLEYSFLSVMKSAIMIEKNDCYFTE